MRKIAFMMCLLMMAAGLSGCIGGDETEISTGGEPIAMTIISQSSVAVNDNDGTWSADMELEILALDIDGNISSLGVDLDLDGTVDIDFSSANGLGIGTVTTNPAHLSLTFSMPYEQSLYATRDSTFTPYCHLRLYNIFALMVGDEDGGITTELATTYSVNDLLGTSNNMMVNGFNSYGILDILQVNSADRAWLNGSDPSSPCPHLPEFSITDHPDSLTSATGDNLVRIEITSANDIGTASLASTNFNPSITEPADCDSIVTFEGTDASNLQTGDAWIISEASNTNGDLCAFVNLSSSVVVQYGTFVVWPFLMAYQEVIVT